MKLCAIEINFSVLFNFKMFKGHVGSFVFLANFGFKGGVGTFQKMSSLFSFVQQQQQ